MRWRTALVFGLIANLWLATSFAQPKRGRPAKPEREAAPKTAPLIDADEAEAPAAAENGKNGAGRSAATEAAAEGSAAPPDDDLGEPPKASAAEGAKPLSPLTPEANEFPAGGLAPPPVDFDRLLGDIATLRSRVAALTTTLFKSKLRVVIETRGSDARIEAMAVTLDDGVVFAAPPRFSADDERVVYEHAVAPGQHVLGLEVERYDARKQEYRSWQSSKFSLQVPESELVEAHFVLEDDSEMGVDFPEDRDGEYDLRVRLRARVSK